MGFLMDEKKLLAKLNSILTSSIQCMEFKKYEEYMELSLSFDNDKKKIKIKRDLQSSGEDKEEALLIVCIKIWMASLTKDPCFNPLNRYEVLVDEELKNKLGSILLVKTLIVRLYADIIYGNIKDHYKNLIDRNRQYINFKQFLEKYKTYEKECIEHIIKFTSNPGLNSHSELYEGLKKSEKKLTSNFINPQGRKILRTVTAFPFILLFVVTFGYSQRWITSGKEREINKYQNNSFLECCHPFFIKCSTKVVMSGFSKVKMSAFKFIKAINFARTRTINDEFKRA